MIIKQGERKDLLYHAGDIEYMYVLYWMLIVFFLPCPQFRLVGKTALKLLLVFVEYTESNSRVLYEGVQTVDSNQGVKTK